MWLDRFRGRVDVGGDVQSVTFDAESDGVEWSALGLLDLVWDLVSDLDWTIDAEFAPGPAAQVAGRYVRPDQTTLSPLTALSGNPQMIEGEIVGRGADGSVRLRMRAIDGRHWDVTATGMVVNRLRERVGSLSPLE